MVYVMMEEGAGLGIFVVRGGQNYNINRKNIVPSPPSQGASSVPPTSKLLDFPDLFAFASPIGSVGVPVTRSHCL